MTIFGCAFWTPEQRAVRRQGKPRGSRLDGHEVFIVGMIEAQKDITLNEMVVA